MTVKCEENKWVILGIMECFIVACSFGISILVFLVLFGIMQGTATIKMPSYTIYSLFMSKLQNLNVFVYTEAEVCE